MNANKLYQKLWLSLYAPYRQSLFEAVVCLILINLPWQHDASISWLIFHWIQNGSHILFTILVFSPGLVK